MTISGRSSSRTSRRGDQTREQILTAARKLFAERGYYQTSVYDLFEQAGITKGAFFHHWKTKEELALAILEDIKDSFETNFFAGASQGRARERIERLLRRMVDLNTSEDWIYGRIFALWCAEMHSAEGSIEPAVHALRARWCMHWQELIRHAQQEHDLRSDISAENLSFLVVCAISGVHLMSGRNSVESTRIAFETLRRTLLT